MAEHPLRFLDCNCGVGVTMSAPLQPAVALIEKMDSLGIAGACAYPLAALEEAPAEANADLLREVKDHPRLHPVWVVGPHQCGEFPKPEKLAAQLSRSGVRMVRLPLWKRSFLKTLDFPLLEDLFDALASRRVPLTLECVDSLDQVSTADFVTLLARWPTLPVILTFPKVEQDDRRFYYLWERFGHFLVELSGYQTLGAIESVTQHFGSGRLVFGSRHPYFTPLQSMLQVIYSGVEESVKRDMAGDTVRQFLREAQL